MEIDDLRGFIDAVGRMGELREVRAAGWDLEIGAITELTAEKKGPALLFDEIPGYPAGYRVLSNAFSTVTRTALALHLPMDLSGIEMLDAWRKKLRKYEPVPPREVSNGPVTQNIWTGDEVDLFKFPVPRWHELDGGRYIATASAVITRDPDEGWVNLGTHRGMVHDKNTIGLLLVHGKHARIMMDKYHARGQNCPVAVAVGQDPTLWAGASYNTPWGVGEYEFAGWLKGRPIEVVKSDLTGLPLPATAEIVLEGEIPPLGTDSRKEGPFGEWPGYYAAVEDETVPIVRVKRVLFRDNPILFGAPPLKPPAVSHVGIPLMSSGAVWEQLETSGIVGIKGVWQLGTTWGGLVLVIAIKQQYAGHSKQVALAATSCQAGAYGGKFTIVVDDEVDITNAEEVLWVVGTRCNVDNIDIVRGIWTSPCDPALPLEIRAGGFPVSSRCIIDACRPYSWMKDFPPVNVFSKEFRQQIAEKWEI